MNWLEQTRASYDVVARNYADFVRGSLDELPVLRSVLVMFAELARGRAPVLDIGCGPGHVSAVLAGLGLAVFGLDLSPAMIDIARSEHPGPRFDVGSMTDLPYGDASAGGALLFWSLIHIPDDRVPTVLAEVFRVLRPGAVVMLGFHVGDRVNRKTSGYGGLPMQLDVHLRSIDTVAEAVRQAGFHLEMTSTIDPDERTPGGVVLARRPAARGQGIG